MTKRILAVLFRLSLAALYANSISGVTVEAALANG